MRATRIRNNFDEEPFTSLVVSALLYRPEAVRQLVAVNWPGWKGAPDEYGTQNINSRIRFNGAREAA